MTVVRRLNFRSFPPTQVGEGDVENERRFRALVEQAFELQDINNESLVQMIGAMVSPAEVAFLEETVNEHFLWEVDAFDNNNWFEVDRIEAVSGYAARHTFSVHAKRIDAFGYFEAEYVALLVEDAGNANEIQGLTTLFRKTTQAGLELRIRDIGNEFIIQVRGRTGQDWRYQIFDTVRHNKL